MIEKKWVVVDATDQIVGRLASKVAIMLRGKNKVYYTPNMDCGDYVIIINAEKVRFTGKKLTDKVYVRHTGYPGGQRFATPKELLARKPEAGRPSARCSPRPAWVPRCTGTFMYTQVPSILIRLNHQY